MTSIRIRQFRPEFWALRSTAALPYPARILRAAMHACANDHGYGETNLHILMGVAFPESDGVTLDDLKGYLRSIAEHCSTTFYSTGGRDYYCITDWDDHHQISKRGKQWCPAFDDPDVEIDQRFHPPQEELPGSPGESRGVHGIPPIRTVEQGNSRTGSLQSSPKSGTELRARAIQRLAAQSIGANR